MRSVKIWSRPLQVAPYVAHALSRTGESVIYPLQFPWCLLQRVEILIAQLYQIRPILVQELHQFQAGEDLLWHNFRPRYLRRKPGDSSQRLQRGDGVKRHVGQLSWFEAPLSSRK